MGIETEKYIRKPLIVDAVRITVQNFDEIAAWCQGEVQTDEVPGTGTTKKFIKVRVHNPKNPRQTKAFVGDWLLYTERGYKVYTNKAFHAAFDLVVDLVAVESAEQEAEFQGSPSVATPPTPIERAATPQEQAEKENDQVDRAMEKAEAGVKELTDAHIHSVGPVAEEPNPETGVQPISEVELRGGPVLPPYVRGTTERAVVTEDQARESMGLPPKEKVENVPVSEQPPEIATEGKRVLSMDEQRKMTQEEIRAELQTGEVILAQDLAEPQRV